MKLVKFKKDYVFSLDGKGHDVKEGHEMELPELEASLLCKRGVCCLVKQTKAKVKK